MNLRFLLRLLGSLIAAGIVLIVGFGSYGCYWKYAMIPVEPKPLGAGCSTLWASFSA